MSHLSLIHRQRTCSTRVASGVTVSAVNTTIKCTRVISDVILAPKNSTISGKRHAAGGTDSGGPASDRNYSSTASTRVWPLTAAFGSQPEPLSRPEARHVHVCARASRCVCHPPLQARTMDVGGVWALRAVSLMGLSSAFYTFHYLCFGLCATINK
ncbi:hypothetical protein C0Q70_04963 [Pomacea canaliculata]|uniref:Uncharacterized protein n=1 Tax=Pomacea canaliculata TaxID=400727 RepID=A0A2T7PJW3_POMCA|nr:hypothetical protein C0Q70_04963 [Pomacea canaliculata]